MPCSAILTRFLPHHRNEPAVLPCSVIVFCSLHICNGTKTNRHTVQRPHGQQIAFKRIAGELRAVHAAACAIPAFSHHRSTRNNWRAQLQTPSLAVTLLVLRPGQRPMTPWAWVRKAGGARWPRARPALLPQGKDGTRKLACRPISLGVHPVFNRWLAAHLPAVVAALLGLAVALLGGVALHEGATLINGGPVPFGF